MFGLDKKYIIFIIDILNKNIQKENVSYYIFGSRATGKYKKYSDIDVAIDMNGEKISPDIMGKILIDFEDSILPYEVDVIDLNSIDNNFKDIIESSLIKLDIDKLSD